MKNPKAAIIKTRKVRIMNGNYNFGGSYAKKPINFDKEKFKKIAITVVIVVLALILLSTCWYTVKDYQGAVITTFGKATGTASAGIHFKLPFGIQKVKLVDVNNIKKIEIGYSGSGEAVESESKMITGDYNIVNVDFVVEYKISDPVKFLFASKQPELILKNLSQSQIRNVIGSYNVDSVLTDKKLEIQLEIKDLITEELSKYDIGLILLNVLIQDAEAPTDAVSQAFKNVEAARQGMETAINEANAYQNKMIPEAEAQADKLLQNAQYLKEKRINEAHEQVAMFEAMYSEYNLNPDITRARMYYEAIETALPGVKIIINTSDGSDIFKFMPLE
ncbi:Modulator of FtsH protease HflK [bioreactor metagenome]|uniref:Modulator of FtsH protease HflK n=1 Tax=bioreactor metagenome TaxID=1076179 RepID=A0A645C6S7_9ZZZZ